MLPNSYLYQTHLSISQILEGCIFLVDKPLHWTSFDVVRKMKNVIGNKVKIGHGGTLDPLATGLLLISTGKCTKMLTQFQNDEKKYTGTITIGASTPSYDLETSFDNHSSYEHVDNELIEKTRIQFLGKQLQYPPIHSAIKKDGKPIYLKARKNEEVIVEPREVTIYEFDIREINIPNITFEIKCSKGTYIRSIAHDFGLKMNTHSYLSSLRRTQSGEHKIENAFNFEDLIEELDSKK